MNDSTDLDLRPSAGRSSRVGWAFSAGLLVGLASAIGTIVLAVAAERRRRQREAGDDETAAMPPTDRGPEATKEWQMDESELDEELAQTFPASDPLPTSHRVD